MLTPVVVECPAHHCALRQAVALSAGRPDVFLDEPSRDAADSIGAPGSGGWSLPAGRVDLSDGTFHDSLLWMPC